MLTENQIKLKEKQKEEQKQIRAFALAKIKLMEDKSIEEEEERDAAQNVLNYKINQAGIDQNKIGQYMMQHHEELIQQIKA